MTGTTSTWADAAGWTGAFALAIGAVILVLAFVGARARFSRATALTMLGVSVALGGVAAVVLMLGALGTFDAVVQKGPSVTPRDMSAGVSDAVFSAGLAALGALLGLIGATRALTSLERPREEYDGVPPAPRPVV